MISREIMEADVSTDPFGPETQSSPGTIGHHKAKRPLWLLHLHDFLFTELGCCYRLCYRTEGEVMLQPSSRSQRVTDRLISEPECRKLQSKL